MIRATRAQWRARRREMRSWRSLTPLERDVVRAAWTIERLARDMAQVVSAAFIAMRDLSPPPD